MGGGSGGCGGGGVGGSQRNTRGIPGVGSAATAVADVLRHAGNKVEEACLLGGVVLVFVLVAAVVAWQDKHAQTK